MSNLREVIHLRGRAETNLSVDGYLVLITIFIFFGYVLSVLLNCPAAGILRNKTHLSTLRRKNSKTQL